MQQTIQTWPIELEKSYSQFYSGSQEIPLLDRIRIKESGGYIGEGVSTHWITRRPDIESEALGLF